MKKTKECELDERGSAPFKSPGILRLKAFRKANINIDAINIGKIKRVGNPLLFLIYTFVYARHKALELHPCSALSSSMSKLII